jgi:hypothetical protein
MFFATSMETSQSIAYAGQAVTVSFYARKGADYSSASSALKVTLRSGTGTDQNVYGYTGGASPINGSTKTLTTTWQRFEATGTVAATATELAVYFHNTPVGTAGTNDYYEVTGVQLELGSVATTFKRAGGTIQGELAACQRYYFRMTPGSAYGPLGIGLATSTTVAEVDVTNPVQMRVPPTAVEYANIALHLPGIVIKTFTSLVLGYTGYTNQTVTTSGSTGLTTSQTYKLTNNNNASAYIAFSAEL